MNGRKTVTVFLVVETHFYKDKQGNIWGKRVVDYNFLKRYLQVFDEVCLCGRCRAIEKVNPSFLKVNGENVKFFELPDCRGIKQTLFCLRDIYKSLDKYIMVCDCAIIRFPTLITMIAFSKVYRKLPIGLELMISAHDMIIGESFFVKLLNRILESVVKKMCLMANGVAYVTEWYLQKIYPSYSIKHPESKEHFHGSYSTVELETCNYHEKKWNKEEKPSEIQMISIGYMDDQRKGQNKIIKALFCLKKQGLKFRMRFVGDGKMLVKYKEMVEQLGLSDCVEFTGAITDRKKIDFYLEKSHLFLYFSKAEGIPRVMIEAMAAGLPCLSNPVDGIVEILPRDCYFLSENPEEMSKKILEMCSDWNNMIQQSSINYQTAQKFRKDILNAKRVAFYTKLYKTVVNEKHDTNI